MCMHFILSGPHTSLHICNHIHYKNCNKIIQKWGRVGQRPFGIFPKIHPIWYSHPSLIIITYFSTSKKENDLKTPCVNQNFRSTLSFSVTCWPILWKMFLTPCILVFKNYIKTINQVLRKVYKRKDGNLWQNIVRDFKGCPVSLSRFTQSIIKVIFVFVWVLLFLFVFVYAFVYSLVVLCLRMTLTNCQKGQRSPHQPCIALKTLKSKGFELSWAPGLGWAAQTYI